MQQHRADDRTRDEAEPVGSRQQHDDEIRARGQERRQVGQNDLGQGDRDDDERRSPRLLAGIEHAQVQKNDRVRNQGERAETQRPPQRFRRRRVETAPCEQSARNGRAEYREIDNDRNQRHQRDLRGHR